ncbi:hypothetical protein BAU17_13990 [Enterococcus sp. CU12B]|uniref:Uncharacterized protein n=1 Tax=Candidatus Enterococcus willemsii TaxID=1857215 RepID=A0ABQ6Z2E8_9ENTE|nr:hypothetical protein BAU17_13990 [Enterococcus sp. CU12B]
MLAKLVTDFNIPHKEALLRRTREDILLDCSNHIVYSNLTNKEKKIELNRIMMTFRKQFQNFDFNNTKITTKLLQRNHVNMYILLKKIQKRIRIYRYKKMLN